MFIGVDIIELSRVARLDASFGSRFRTKFLHPAELARAASLTEPSRAASFLAARWAAKEALHKAFNGGSALPLRFLFPDMELAVGASGAPCFRLHGAAREHAETRGLRLSVSIAHERSAAVAFVVAQEAQERLT
jgi:holo-[acyl-carrier protein] synthase